MNFVDPDGNRWVNSKGQVVYDSNGLTAYATHEEAYLANTMQKTRTGSKQLKKIAEAPFDVEVVINSIDRPNYYGITENAGIMINRTIGQYTPKHSRITLYKLKAIRRSVFLWMMDALAINFAHEIEHITDQNLKLQYEGRSVEEREESPDRISQEMTREYYNIEPLKSTDDLYRLLNHLVQSNKNIQINFSN